MIQRIIFTLATLATLIWTCVPGQAAYVGTPALQENRSMNLSGTGVATVLGCLEGGPPPCAGTTRATYTGQVSGSPFNEFKYFREPEDFSGYLDFPASGFDPQTGCYSNVSGVFEVVVYRGRKGRVAFELIVSGSSCGGGSGNSFIGTVSLDSINAEDPAFRDAVGSGTMLLQDNLDLSVLNSGVFSTDVNGQVTLRH